MQPNPDLPLWTHRVDQIRVGMRREEVERILQPLHLGYFDNTTISGGSQAVLYDVAPGYSVSVFYDYTGVLRDSTGVARSTNSPDNRVIQPPVLHEGSVTETILGKRTMKEPNLEGRVTREPSHNPG